MRFKLLTFLLITLAINAHGGLLRPGFEGVRPTGMGDAFTALADDANTLFYNPAGLARIHQVHFNMMDFTLGADGDNTLTRLNNAVFKSDFTHLIRADREFVRMSFKPTFVMPGFGISFFQDANGYFDLKSPQTTGIDVYAHNDLGVQAGIGVPLGDFFAVGVSGKVFERTGIDFNYNVNDIMTNSSLLNAIQTGDIYNVFKDLARTGWGIGLNAGVLARIPLHTNEKNGPKLNASAVADNIGNTTFKPLGGAVAPQSIRQSYTLGLAYSAPLDKSWVWNTTADVKHVLESLPFVKQFHLGTEFRHKIFAVRGGISEGYPAFGFSVEFPPHTRIHFSSFAKELGSSLNSSSSRWYLLQFIIGFNPI